MINLDISNLNTKQITWRNLEWNKDHQLIIQTEVGMIVITFSEEQFASLFKLKEYTGIK